MQGLNAKPFFEFKDAKEFKQWVAMIPTSAHTGEGIPDLMMLLVQLTQNLMASRIAFVDKVCPTSAFIHPFVRFSSSLRTLFFIPPYAFLRPSVCFSSFIRTLFFIPPYIYIYIISYNKFQR